MHGKRFGTTLALWVLGSASALSADLTARQVTDSVFRASSPVDFAGKNLSFLDLEGLDFKKARFAGANLYGTDLSKTKLAGSDLSGARLDRASLANADLTGANLSHASLLSITAHTTLEPNPADAPVFAGADLSDAYIASRLDGADFRNANLSRARIGKLIATWGSYQPRALLMGANFNGATLIDADLSNGVFRFAKLRDANLRGAKLMDCDFSQADLTGADLTGADVTGADFDGAVIAAVKGLDQALGLDQAKNLAKAVR